MGYNNQNKKAIIKLIFLFYYCKLFIPAFCFGDEKQAEKVFLALAESLSKSDIHPLFPFVANLDDYKYNGELGSGPEPKNTLEMFALPFERHVFQSITMDFWRLKDYCQKIKFEWKNAKLKRYGLALMENFKLVPFNGGDFGPGLDYWAVSEFESDKKKVFLYAKIIVSKEPKRHKLAGEIFFTQLDFEKLSQLIKWKPGLWLEEDEKFAKILASDYFESRWIFKIFKECSIEIIEIPEKIKIPSRFFNDFKNRISVFYSGRFFEFNESDVGSMEFLFPIEDSSISNLKIFDCNFSFFPFACPKIKILAVYKSRIDIKISEPPIFSAIKSRNGLVPFEHPNISYFLDERELMTYKFLPDFSIIRIYPEKALAKHCFFISFQGDFLHNIIVRDKVISRK
jgi:hypothetical protein